MKHRKIKIGSVHGYLRVLEDLGMQQANPDTRKRVYRCQCEYIAEGSNHKCGKIVDVPIARLGKRTKSCGCLHSKGRRINIEIGARFGRLTVLSLYTRGARHRYMCRCDCGKRKVILAKDLRESGTKSCGCLKIEDGANILMMRLERTISSNTSGTTGVDWFRRKGEWRARITLKGKTYHLGLFDKLEEAVAARQKAEAELFKPFLEELEKKRAGNRT